MNNLKLVKKYKELYGHNSSFYSMTDDLEEVKALWGQVSVDIFLTRCVCNRKRHQRLIRKTAVDKAVNNLKGELLSLQKCVNFEELYDSVFKLIGIGKTGISYCTVYDTCIRMGYCFSPQILPNDFVYVHRHLKREANEIVGYGNILNKCRIKRCIFDKKDKAFMQLTCLEIEDFLCVRHKL